jgi:phosphopantothenoylcysteine decarboxylase/phosphopantothenate--cysteine ligase
LGKIVLGVTGSIAAYKAVPLLREFIKREKVVVVALTENAKKFITPLTFEALSGNRVITDLFTEHSSPEIAHTSLADSCDLLVVAPATANIIGKFASGIADDFLTTFFLSTDAPVVIAPAMNSRMYAHPVVKGNIERLKKLGVIFVEPEEGWLACGAEGMGRLAPVDKIASISFDILGKKKRLKGSPS